MVGRGSQQGHAPLTNSKALWDKGTISYLERALPEFDFRGHSSSEPLYALYSHGVEKPV